MKVITTPEVQLEVDKVTVKRFNTQNTADYIHKRGFNGWHSHKLYEYSIRNRNIGVGISDSIGGCGMQQIYGWYHSGAYSYKEVKYCLIKLLQDLHYGVGLIICQVGQDFFSSYFVKSLEEMGFTYETYDNHQHGDGYEQRLYKLVIPKQD